VRTWSLHYCLRSLFTATLSPVQSPSSWATCFDQTGHDQAYKIQLTQWTFLMQIFHGCNYCHHIKITGSRVSSGSIVYDRAIGVRSPAGAKDFSSNLCVQTGSGAHPASCTMGTGVLSLGLKERPGRDADHSPPSSAEVVNEYELYLLSPQAPPWRVAGLLYLFYLFTLL
jgi:hypothetical protein